MARLESFGSHRKPSRTGFHPSIAKPRTKFVRIPDLLEIIGLGRALRCQNEFYQEVLSGLLDAFTFPCNQHGELQL